MCRPMVSSSTRPGTGTTSTADQRRERVVAEIVCPRCGHRNPLGSNFCSSCGSSLGEHPEDTATLAYDAPHVVVDAGSGAGSGAGSAAGSSLVAEDDGIEQVEADH